MSPRFSRTRKPDELLERLEERAESDPEFTAAEIELLRQIIEAYRGWAMLGRMTKWFVAALAGFSVIAVGMSHLAAGIKRWLGI